MPLSPIATRSQSSFFSTLLGPELPEKKGPPARKDALDYADDYLRESRGAWDFYRILREPLYYLSRTSSLGAGGKTLVEKLIYVLTAAGTGLSCPKLISDTNTLRKSVQQAQAASAKPYSDPIREQKVLQTRKNVFLNTANLVNTGSEAILFLHHVTLVALSALQFRLFDGIYNVTNLIYDTQDLAVQGYKLRHFYTIAPQLRKTSEKVDVENRKTLAWMTIAQDISSIGASSIYLIGIVFSVAIESVPMAPAFTLFLGSYWLISKVTNTFYEKIVIEKST